MKAASADQPAVYTIKQVMIICQISKATVYRMIEQGIFKGIPMPVHYRVTVCSVQAYLAGGKAPKKKPPSRARSRGR